MDKLKNSDKVNASEVAAFFGFSIRKSKEGGSLQPKYIVSDDKNELPPRVITSVDQLSYCFAEFYEYGSFTKYFKRVHIKTQEEFMAWSLKAMKIQSGLLDGKNIIDDISQVNVDIDTEEELEI